MVNADDRWAIQELQSRYCWAIDSSDGEAFAATFTEDGTFTGGQGTLHGRQELHDFAVKAGLRSRRLQHWVGNLVLNVREDGDVDGVCYMMASYSTGAPVFGEPGVAVERLGTYRDHIVRTAEGWRFKSRTFTAWVPDAA